MAETKQNSALMSAYKTIVDQMKKAAVNYGKKAPRLVAVSKLKPAEMIRSLHASSGHLRFGENYVQELCEKAEELPKEIEWHLIGHLQSNKCNQVVKGVPNLAVVETVDSQKLAKKLNHACEQFRETPLRVFLQVNTSNEESKSGCDPKQCLDLASFIHKDCNKLILAGLMTIGKYGDPNPVPYFNKLSELRSQVEDTLSLESNSLELSMGMSGDFEKAIECGSTNIRVGSSIFGARN